MPAEQGRGDCQTCGAGCCRYVTVEIAKPRAHVDVEEVRWFLAHENVHVYIDADDGSWNVQFHTNCRHLDRWNRCRIYSRRYDICREHDAEDCEASQAEAQDTVFHTTDEFDAWWRKEKAGRKRRNARRRKARAAAGTQRKAQA